MNNKIEIESFKLIGLALKSTTTNQNGQSAIDCGNLWQKFESGSYADKIPGKPGNEIFAVYYHYEGDHTNPFSYFIGCKVKAGTVVPEGLDSISLQKGKYRKFIAKGKMPDCIANAWKEIWSSDIHRAYAADFEVYGEKSKDWNNAQVEIFISIK